MDASWTRPDREPSPAGIHGSMKKRPPRSLSQVSINNELLLLNSTKAANPTSSQHLVLHSAFVNRTSFVLNKRPPRRLPQCSKEYLRSILTLLNAPDLEASTLNSAKEAHLESVRVGYACPASRTTIHSSGKNHGQQFITQNKSQTTVHYSEQQITEVEASSSRMPGFW
jgi:hypothetical protein